MLPGEHTRNLVEANANQLGHLLARSVHVRFVSLRKCLEQITPIVLQRQVIYNKDHIISPYKYTSNNVTKVCVFVYLFVCLYMHCRSSFNNVSMQSVILRSHCGFTLVQFQQCKYAISYIAFPLWFHLRAVSTM